MNTPVIYKIRNVVNQKFYVGSTTNKRERFRNHRKLLRRGVHHCKHLQAAWNKYGEECFVFEVVEEIPNAADLWAAEDRWLDEHHGKPYCYNSGRSADAPMRGKTGPLHHSYGKSWPEEVRAAISGSLKTFYAENPEQHPRLGKTHTEEAKTKMALKHVPRGEEHYRYGQTLSEEVRAKISATQKGRPNPRKGQKMSEQGRANVAAAVKRGEESHFYGKRPVSADLLQKPIYVRKPDGALETFPSLSYIRDTFGVTLPTIIRACKSGKPVKTGAASGWEMSYTPFETVSIPPEYAHLPRTRQLAKEQGAAEYFTGLPCSHGHIAPRKVKGTCVECLKLETARATEARKGKPKSDAAKAAGRRYYERKKLSGLQTPDVP